MSVIPGTSVVPLSALAKQVAALLVGAQLSGVDLSGATIGSAPLLTAIDAQATSVLNNQKNSAFGVAGLNSAGAITGEVDVSVPNGTSRSLVDKSADYINVKDYGAKGDVTAKYVSQNTNSGATVIPVMDTQGIYVGESISASYGSAVFSQGTIVTATTNNTITLSQPTQTALSIGNIVDLGATDDSAAITQAAQAACSTGKGLVFPPGRYHAPTSVYCAAMYISLAHASLTSSSAGLPGVADQSQIFVPNGDILSGEMEGANTQNVQYVAGVFSASGSLNSYQHNVQSVVGRNNDPYQTYTDATGTSHLATHDAVGQFVAMTQAASNTFGNTWNSNHVLGLEQGSNGSAVIDESQIINSRTTSGSDFDGSNTVGGYDEIYNCNSSCLYAHFFQGAPNGHPGLVNGLVFRRGTVANMDIGQLSAAYTQPDGTTSAANHVTDWAIYSSGLGFFQKLHIGGGTSAGDVMPTSGADFAADGSLTTPVITTTTVNTTALNASSHITVGSDTNTPAAYLDLSQQGGFMRLLSSSTAFNFLQGGGNLLAQLSATGAYFNTPVSTNGNPLSSGPLSLSRYTHDKFPSNNVPFGTLIICTDCYPQGPAQNGYGSAGLLLMWNGLNWVDGAGYIYGLAAAPPYLTYKSMAKADILKLTSVPSGAVLQDSDDNTLVVYESGAWHPITMGAALQ